MDWIKDLPGQIVVTDEYGREHTCSKRLVGMDWFGPGYKIEYFERDFTTDETTVYLSASGDSQETAAENMYKLLSETSNIRKK